MNFDRPLSIRETAQALNVSRTKVYEFLARGDLAAVKLDGKTLVLSSQVEKFFSSLPQAKFQPLPAA